MKNFDSFSSDILTDQELASVRGGGGSPENEETSVDFGDAGN